MSANTLIALASLVTALGAGAAAVVAAYALRAQQRGEQRHHDLENLRWITDQFRALGEMRRRAAKSLLGDEVDHYALREVLNFFESSGLLVRQGYITEETFSQISRVQVIGWWEAAERVIREARARVNPALYDQFEWLKGRMQTERVELNEAWIEEFLRREADLPIFQAAAR